MHGRRETASSHWRTRPAPFRGGPPCVAPQVLRWGVGSRSSVRLSVPPRVAGRGRCISRATGVPTQGKTGSGPPRGRSRLSPEPSGYAGYVWLSIRFASVTLRTQRRQAVPRDRHDVVRRADHPLPMDCMGPGDRAAAPITSPLSLAHRAAPWVEPDGPGHGTEDEGSCHEHGHLCSVDAELNELYL